jgi:hypothetical protein
MPRKFAFGCSAPQPACKKSSAGEGWLRGLQWQLIRNENSGGKSIELSRNKNCVALGIGFEVLRTTTVSGRKRRRGRKAPGLKSADLSCKLQTRTQFGAFDVCEASEGDEERFFLTRPGAHEPCARRMRVARLGMTVPEVAMTVMVSSVVVGSAQRNRA